jgi:uncharacterized protein
MTTRVARRPLLTPAVSRILPFAIYIGFLAVESTVPSGSLGLDARWLYALKVSCVAVALALLWNRYSELGQVRSVATLDWLLALILGASVFVLWIFLDQPWAMLGEPRGWNPLRADGQFDMALVAVRLAGAVVVVPVMEELFWRALVMRWIRNPDFLNVEPRRVGAAAFVISSALFALEHHQWLAGLLAGFAYAWVYMRTGNLWTAVAAHAVTNLLLGIFVIYTGQWQFW